MLGIPRTHIAHDIGAHDNGDDEDYRNDFCGYIGFSFYAAA